MNVLERWNLVFLAGFAVYFWIRHVFLRRTRNETKVVSRFDKSEKILLAAMFSPVILLPLLYLFTPLLAFADYRLPTFAPGCGAATMVASLWLFWRSHADLGQNWSVSLEIREGHPLGIGQRELRRVGLAIEALDFRDGGGGAGTARLEEFLGLLAKLFEAGTGGKNARGRSVGSGHDVLLSAADWPHGSVSASRAERRYAGDQQ